jgi:hypothetical protein
MALNQQQFYEAGKGNIWEQWNAGKISEAQAMAELGGGGAQSADQVMQQMMSELTTKYAELGKKYMEYNTQNPFSFDEALAKASAEERLSPYYKAELTDYVSGVERQKESIEGERNLLTELNKMAVGADKRNLDEAVRASEEGFAGAGLYTSGARERATGMQEISGEEARKQRELQYGNNLSNLNTQGANLAAGLTTTQRQSRAAEQTALQTDVELQRKQKNAQWQVGRMESLGPEFVGKTLSSGGLESFLTSAYQ